jgi:hypothetical protein
MAVDDETYMCSQICTVRFLNNKRIPSHSAAMGSLKHSAVLGLQLQLFLGGGETCMLLQICMFQSSNNTEKKGEAQ